MSGSVLTYLVHAQIRDDIQSLEGELLTRPALIKTDGTNLTYAADVKIPGYDDPLRNVTIAMGARDVIASEVGQAVALTRSASGCFEVTGLSKKKPGTRTRIPVYLGTIGGAVPGEPGVPPVVGIPALVGLSVHRLTIGEMGSLPYAPRGWGSLPLGSYALYRGSTFLGLNGAINEGDQGGSTPASPPTIQTFSASPASITLGDSATLTWNVVGATSLILSGTGAVSTPGSQQVTPSASTTYTLTASNPAGTVTATVTVTVGSEAPIDLAYDFGSTP